MADIYEELRWDPERDGGAAPRCRCVVLVKEPERRADADKPTEPGTLYYRTCHTWEVPADKRDAAQSVLTYCVNALGLPPKTPLEWFVRAEPDYNGPVWCTQEEPTHPIAGIATRRRDGDVGTIRIRADRSVEQIRETVAHECKHLAQPSWTTDNIEECERDAGAYQKRAQDEQKAAQARWHQYCAAYSRWSW